MRYTHLLAITVMLAVLGAIEITNFIELQEIKKQLLTMDGWVEIEKSE